MDIRCFLISSLLSYDTTTTATTTTKLKIKEKQTKDKTKQNPILENNPPTPDYELREEIKRKASKNNHYNNKHDDCTSL